MDFFANSTPLENVFWFCALVGTLLFMVRFIMMMVTGGGEGEGIDGGGVDGDVGAVHDGGGVIDSDATFHVFSLHTIIAFVMMFGWAGLSAYRQFYLGAGLSVFVALITGLLFMFLTAYLLKKLRGLASPGATFDISQTIGMKANVYQRIPANGRGRIQISREGTNTLELDAVSETNEEIPSFKTVEIVKIIDDKTVAVKTVA